MQHLTYSISLGNYYGKRPCQPNTGWSTGNFTCALVSLQDQRVWSFVWDETTCAHAYNIKKMTSYATSSRRAVLWTAFLTRITLKLWRCSVVWKLHTVISINFVLNLKWVLKPFWSYRCLKSGLNKERIWKLPLSLLHTSAFSCLPRGFWALIWVLLIIKANRKTRHFNKILAYLWWKDTAFA